MRIKFDYMNSSGEKSTRSVTDIEIVSPFHIIAYCELRNADRTFDLEAIQNAFDLEINQPIPDIFTFLGMLNKDGSINKKFENIARPDPIEFHCSACGVHNALEIRWLKRNSKFTCACGRVFNIQAKPRAEGERRAPFVNDHQGPTSASTATRQ